LRIGMTRLDLDFWSICLRDFAFVLDSRFGWRCMYFPGVCRCWLMVARWNKCKLVNDWNKGIHYPNLYFYCKWRVLALWWNSWVTLGFFKGFRFPNLVEVIFHLRYADYTFFYKRDVSGELVEYDSNPKMVRINI